MSKIELHPVQSRGGYGAKKLRTEVTLRAYEVYKALHGEQKAMITGGCRGGMSDGEIVAFLYARSFPQDQWAARVEEAFEGMENFA